MHDVTAGCHTGTNQKGRARRLRQWGRVKTPYDEFMDSKYPCFREVGSGMCKISRLLHGSAAADAAPTSNCTAPIKVGLLSR